MGLIERVPEQEWLVLEAKSAEFFAKWAPRMRRAVEMGLNLASCAELLAEFMANDFEHLLRLGLEYGQTLEEWQQFAQCDAAVLLARRFLLTLA
ncbi:MAG: hypothetical protein ACPL7M_00065 [Bryobacteraceae bacterium]